MDPDDVHWWRLSIIFLAHWKVDKSEDVKLYQDRETQKDCVEEKHIDAQFFVQFPFVYVDSTDL